MASFNHQQIMINSFDNTVDDEFFDLKPFFSENFSPFSSCNSNSLLVETHQTSSDDGLMLKQFNNSTNWSSQAAAQLSHQKTSPAFSSGPQLISFGKSSNSSISDSDKLLDDMICNMKTRSITRSPSQAQHHVEAERKRREKLSELFISLSKIVPGLKKLDKASLLGDAIKHMKELQERVKILEEEAKRDSMEFHAMETRSSISTSNNDSSFIKENSNGTMRGSIPDVRIRVSNKKLLIKIHCEKHNRFVTRIPIEMEKLRLSLLDIRAIPFGCSILDITILAEMDGEHSTTVEDIIKHLQIAILRPQETLKNSFSEDCFHHLSPFSGSEAWQV